ncbi:MAG: ABC-type Co2+ transport system, permease component [Planctomycetota bacterium]|nr:ABC-type Co2+ transport system, permease component [Planctomycetota bacterium]
MHIPDAVLSPPVGIATGVVGAVGFLYGLRRLERQSGEKTVVLMGMMSAFLFAAQMVNFPVLPGVSGHLLGGLLASVLLGPWAGACVVGAVLIVQCFLYGDGGVTALGANFLNMGLIGSLGGYAMYAPIRRAIGGRKGILLGSMVAAWLSVILAAGAFAVELAVGGRGSFFTVLGWMTLVHAAIGLGEALITGVVVRFVLLTRPDLIHDVDAPPASSVMRWGQVAMAGVAVSLSVAVFLAPFASNWDDGLEHVGAKVGFLKKDAPVVLAGVFPDYQWPLLGTDRLGIATAAAGAVGTVLVFGVGSVLARAFVRKGPGEIGPDAV